MLGDIGGQTSRLRRKQVAIHCRGILWGVFNTLCFDRSSVKLSHVLDTAYWADKSLQWMSVRVAREDFPYHTQDTSKLLLA